ncbi:MAG: HEPN domain-containing protein [Candidatus Zixiibacteriota bacterium]|nr:MAG: HEPN domain-containing protein [candidate division Zixibacteria bacterium]
MIPRKEEHILEILHRADEKLDAANLLLSNEHWNDAASRAYYAAFHAVSAVL